MAASADDTGSSVRTLLAPMVEILKAREHNKPPREKLRDSVAYAIMNAGCTHQSAISIADAECIADAVLLAILQESGEA
jgi:hypothetical protein